jgi:hypothetical protein
MDGFKDSTRMKYMTGGPVKKMRGGMMDEGVSTRPTDSSGRRMTNEELGMTPGGVDPAKKKKPMPKGLGAVTDRELQMLKKAVPALKRKAPGLGAVTDREMQMLKKAVPAYSDKPMIRRSKGGLMAMPKGKCK